MLCRTNKLTHDDMAMMTIGMCLEYIETYNEVHHSKSTKKNKVVQAKQSDFDAF
ncbi:hypothetical protein QN089_05635 [Kurthia sp. YJT4]|uniref:hypothetical protein n=1 Tax=Kurthia sp. YJT4 TaxID=3049086 RepID=UPI00254CF1F2|nr:hypothetical protein [Kurthia sp. YJT4]WIL39750.1 hypothetical protein QN089_05635 [Kurthia sp. YJT4]